MEGKSWFFVTPAEAWDWIRGWRKGGKRTPKSVTSARTSDQQARVARVHSAPSTSDLNTTEDRENRRVGQQETEIDLAETESRHAGAEE
ncbi:hypothetical protein NDU88_006697 [Pleurodeles waltl]|uniref:Uncharacterized protein n=1 Tax=Pleurodeles waltl TaxID=8319 RepID=A0AAV7RNS4_PLEWA|nr:hypothetical protein NDU88_006697 [Pleurodeles waltl]